MPFSLYAEYTSILLLRFIRPFARQIAQVWLSEFFSNTLVLLEVILFLFGRLNIHGLNPKYDIRYIVYNVNSIIFIPTILDHTFYIHDPVSAVQPI